MTPEVSIDWGTFQSVVISLALGGIIGLERQAQADPEYQRETAGVRTFSLAALLGTLAAFGAKASAAIPVTMAAGFLLLVVVHYFIDAKYRGKSTGITTEVAGLIVFVLGVLVPSHPVFAASVAVIVALILSVKSFTHQAIERMSRPELYATLKFLLVTVVFLPLLPDTTVDPWGIYNPRELWFLVVLISGISFIGYYAMRFLGTGRGIAVTGLLGGLASSTAVALAMSGRVAEAEDRPDVLRAATFAVVMANGIMFVRVMVEVAAVNRSLLADLWLPVIVTACAGLIPAAWLWWRIPRSGETVEETREELELRNPFKLLPALKFGLIFVAIIGVVHVAKTSFGDSGLYVASLISGLADADATSLTAARLNAHGALAAHTAVRTVLIAALSNSLVKAGIGAFVGGPRFGRWLLLSLLAPVTVGIAAMLLLV